MIRIFNKNKTVPAGIIRQIISYPDRAILKSVSVRRRISKESKKNSKRKKIKNQRNRENNSVTLIINQNHSSYKSILKAPCSSMIENLIFAHGYWSILTSNSIYLSK